MRFAIVLVLLLYGPSVFGDELERGAIPFKADGVVVTTSPIRKAPPHGLLNLFLGKEVESTIQGSTVKIIGKKTYGGFSGVNVWYQLEAANELTATIVQPLWVYGGIEGDLPLIKIQNQSINGGSYGN